MNIANLQKKIQEMENDNEYKRNLITKLTELTTVSRNLDDELEKLTNGEVIESTSSIAISNGKRNLTHKEPLVLQPGEYPIYGYIRFENDTKTYGICIRDSNNKLNPRRCTTLGSCAIATSQMLDKLFENKDNFHSLYRKSSGAEAFETNQPFAKAHFTFAKDGSISSMRNIVSLEKIEEKAE